MLNVRSNKHSLAIYRIVGERTNACCIIVAGCFQKYREYCTNDADSHIQRGRKRKSQYEQKRRGTANRRFSQSRTDRRKQTEDSRGMLAFVFVMQIMIKALSDRARRRASTRVDARRSGLLASNVCIFIQLSITSFSVTHSL